MTTTRLPSSGVPPFDGPRTCDASGMIEVHRTFRRGFEEAPALVRRVPDGDATRTAAVVDHLRLLRTMLDAHHRGEDERLWSWLDERAPACALHVERMSRQHAVMHARLTALDPVLARWEQTAAATDGDAVVAELESITDALAEHLPDEERSIVPAMEHVLTPSENAWFERHGRASTPRGRMWPVVGMIADAQPDGDAWIRRNLPAPLRLAWRLVGAPRYARYRAAIGG